MSGFPGVVDTTIYHGLNDVLKRLPEVTTVTYEPNSIEKRALCAFFDPNRLTPPTGPETSYLTIEWRLHEETQYFRIDYADPNVPFHCGWHRDDDHNDLGPIHFQYETAEMSTPDRESAHFDSEIPTEILWEATARLLDEKLPSIAPWENNS